MTKGKKLTGLNSVEAKSRIKQFGFNELAEHRFATALLNFFKILSDPMGLMLLILSAIYWMLGNSNDAIILLIAYIPIVTVDVILELKSQKALRLLKRSLKSTCHVIRDGKTQQIATRELVPGDYLVLEEGQTLPADGALIQTSHVTIDESTLTGEAVPIAKSLKDEVFSGTVVLTGNGIVEISQTGFNSELGKIAKVLRQLDATPSPLLRTINQGVRIAFLVALALAAFVFAMEWTRNHSIGESIIAALTLAMAAIPEEFPLVFTLYLSLAAYRLSKRGVLVKSLPAVEGLGRVDIICTDKTGTLTEGKFILEEIFENEPATSEEILKLALVGSCELKAVDAMEASIFEYVSKRWSSAWTTQVHESWVLENDYPFDPKEKTMSHTWINRNDGRQFIAMKGALEGVLTHCGAGTDRNRILEIANRQAAMGKRLLGLAYATHPGTGIRAKDEQNLQLIGILSFADPIRHSVPAAIKECQDRKIALKMLTGDHLLTAHSIADAIGLPHSHDELFSGPELEKLHPEQRRIAYMKGAIFARLKPEQKLELVQALKAEGKIVAMTGDGMNDAPALKLADVGISMGDRATDVARSSAQIILLKNDFSGIVSSLIEGQNVLKSLSASFGYLIAFHLPIILVALAQALFLESSILKPIHIVLLELIVHPVSAFVFSAAPHAGELRAKKFLTAQSVIWSCIRGLVLTGLCLGIYFESALPPTVRNSAAVLMLVAGNIGLLIAESGGIRPLFSNTKLLPLVAAMVLLLLTLALAYVPALSRIFSIETPEDSFIGLICGLGIALALLVPRKRN